MTDRISLYVPNSGNYLRYSVLVKTHLLTSDPDLYKYEAFNFTSRLATVLQVSEGILELKKISNNETHLLFHVTLPQNRRPIGPIGPINEKTRNLFDILYIRNTDMCPSKINSYPDPEGATSTYDLPDTQRGEHVKILFEDTCLVFVCDGDEIEGADWKEVKPNYTNWKRKWGLPCKSILIKAANELHHLTLATLKSNQLPSLTSMVKTLLASGAGGSAPTTTTLHELDHILTTLELGADTGGVVQDVTPEVSILVSDLDQTNPVTGIAFNPDDGDDSLVEIRSNERGGAHYSEGTQVAVEIPPSLASRHTKLAFVLISAGNAFKSKKSSLRIKENSIIINILLSNKDKITSSLFKGEFVDILFKPRQAVVSGTEKKVCVFWDEQEQDWSGVGCELNHTTAEGMDVCRCYHLTHFAQIITSGNQQQLSPAHETALEVISIVGCTLSLFGLLVILVTAVVFKSWRLELGNKILLNLAAALALNLVSFLLIYGGVGGDKGAGCITVGAILHYSVLACFCWMLIMSGLQVLRLLTILGNKGISNLLLKASVFGWGVPLVPIITLLAWDRTSFYNSTTVSGIGRTFCYPSGAAFYATIAAPVGFIVTINVVLYVVIICRLCSCFGWGTLNTGLKRHGITDGIIAMRRLRTLIFLFFLFGLTWTFGLLARYLFFTYVFCLTAPLQGFVIFFFFFVIEKKSRVYWQRICCAADVKRTDSATDQSSKTKSTWYSESVPLKLQDDDLNSTRKRLRSESVIPSSDFVKLTNLQTEDLLTSASDYQIPQCQEEEVIVDTLNLSYNKNSNNVSMCDHTDIRNNLNSHRKKTDTLEMWGLPKIQNVLQNNEDLHQEDSWFPPQVPVLEKTIKPVMPNNIIQPLALENEGEEQDATNIKIVCADNFLLKNEMKIPQKKIPQKRHNIDQLTNTNNTLSNQIEQPKEIRQSMIHDENTLSESDTKESPRKKSENPKTSILSNELSNIQYKMNNPVKRNDLLSQDQKKETDKCSNSYVHVPESFHCLRPLDFHGIQEPENSLVLEKPTLYLNSLDDQNIYLNDTKNQTLLLETEGKPKIRDLLQSEEKIVQIKPRKNLDIGTSNVDNVTHNVKHPSTPKPPPRLIHKALTPQKQIEETNVNMSNDEQLPFEAIQIVSSTQVVENLPLNDSMDPPNDAEVKSSSEPSTSVSNAVQNALHNKRANKPSLAKCSITRNMNS